MNPQPDFIPAVVAITGLLCFVAGAVIGSVITGKLKASGLLIERREWNREGTGYRPRNLDELMAWNYGPEDYTRGKRRKL